LSPKDINDSAKEFDFAFSSYNDGNIQQAQTLCLQILKKAPEHIEALQLLGIIYGKQGRYADSVQQLSKVIELKPDSPKTFNNLGVALMKLGNLDEAAYAFNKAISLQSNFKQAYNNFGLVLKKQCDFTQAEAAFEKALQIDPQYAEAIGNLGMMFLSLGKFEQAAENLRKAIDLMPGFAEFYNNLGTAVMELGQFDDALTAFGKAMEIEPQLAEPHHNRALVLLLTGQFEQGWKEFEWRWKNSGFSTPSRPFTQKRWDGSDEGVGKLLIWAEQGIGDEVQFSGLIPLIIDKGIKVIVECDKRFVSILQRSLPKATVIARSDAPAKELDDASITHQIPMCSLPGVLGWPLNLRPHILPDENLRSELRNRYKAGENILLAGISWKSGNTQEGAKRSIDLEYWEPILKIAGVRFICLQYGRCEKQIQDANMRFGIEIIKDEKINPFTDLEGFAAQTAAMDIVISVDNSTVHFAGAMRTAVWTLLAKTPDWRWGLQDEKTCWYSSMRLFRQEERGDWKPVIAKVAEELRKLI